MLSYTVCVDDFKPSEDAREAVGSGVRDALCMQGLQGVEVQDG